MMLALGSLAFAVNIDGALSPGEYAREIMLDKGNFKILWQIEGETVFMAIEAKAPGWVALGFEPTNVMANADMIFGLVGEGKDVQVIDAWSSGMFGPHPPDADQGGKNNVLSFAGSRKDGKVIFEFSRLLNTGDKFDKVIPKTGNLKLIWAYGPNLKFSANHMKAGSATLPMDGVK
jgi:hypothetical protein